MGKSARTTKRIVEGGTRTVKKVGGTGRDRASNVETKVPSGKRRGTSQTSQPANKSTPPLKTGETRKAARPKENV